ncbi:hypothetical protein [Sphingomonas hengshuiensis]|uniref:hypothetical protein n=1 Tax=Sphingomonas hengshuiensis TaxID=1609977 RepID=UPI0006987E9A|nr:hypothetical protein [Sphingomonas hengshuiensis]
MLDLIALAAAASIAAPQGQDCRAIADATLRLACYDARDRAAATPAAPARAAAPAPVAPTAPRPRAVVEAPAPAAPARALSSAEIVRADRTGKLVAVTRMRHGLHRLTLDDGRAFTTTSDTAAPPPVGASVRLRRTALGTTFLDVEGRGPLTVRLVRVRN